ncbi:MAG: DUF6263 family protein [Ferruginibacter sp.]
MKKINLAFFTATALSVLLFSCNNGLPGEAYTIKMRMNKADTFHHNIKMDMNMKMDMMGKSMDMKMNMEAGTRFEVMDNTSANKELKLTYTGMHMGMDMGNKGMARANTDSILNASTEKLIGRSVLIELSPTNEITQIKGFDSLMLNNTDNEESRQMMEKMFSKDQMNSLFGMMFNMYPGKPVKVGETWTAKTKVNLANMDMQVNMTYKLVGVKNGVADIDANGIIDGKGDMKQSGSSVGISMSGTQKGMFTIKMDDGYMQNGSYKMDVKAEIETAGQKVPMTMKANYVLSNK